MTTLGSRCVGRGEGGEGAHLYCSIKVATDDHREQVCVWGGGGRGAGFLFLSMVAPWHASSTHHLSGLHCGPAMYPVHHLLTSWPSL